VEKLTERQIVDQLANQITEWSLVGDSITRTFQFDDFVQSMAFVNRIAEMAEKAQHHPDILIRWNKVTLTLSTHDAGGITEKDFDLAASVDFAAAHTPVS
jgi:4a-hydroxytetrahydrobiopterin dehydratase